MKIQGLTKPQIVEAAQRAGVKTRGIIAQPRGWHRLFITADDNDGVHPWRLSLLVLTESFKVNFMATVTDLPAGNWIPALRGKRYDSLETIIRFIKQAQGDAFFQQDFETQENLKGLLQPLEEILNNSDNDLPGLMMKYELGQLPEPEATKLFQNLINTGLIYNVEPWWLGDASDRAARGEVQVNALPNGVME